MGFFDLFKEKEKLVLSDPTFTLLCVVSSNSKLKEDDFNDLLSFNENGYNGDFTIVLDDEAWDEETGKSRPRQWDDPLDFYLKVSETSPVFVNSNLESIIDTYNGWSIYPISHGFMIDCSIDLKNKKVTEDTIKQTLKKFFEEIMPDDFNNCEVITDDEYNKRFGDEV